MRKLRLLCTGDILRWQGETFTVMKNLEWLSLQGHINAVEFFGIDMRNIRTLELDMLDELGQLVGGQNG